MFKKHLKIVEQIAIVVIFAVIVPMTVSGFIINNINQQAVRYQLRESAILIASMVSDEIEFFNDTANNSLEQIAFQLEYFPTNTAKKAYLENIIGKLPGCKNLAIVNEFQLDEIKENDKRNQLISVSYKLPNDKYLVASYQKDNIRNKIFKSLKDEKRQIYVLTDDKNLFAELNYRYEDYKKTLSLLPKVLVKDEPVIFGDIKNQPLVYVSKGNPNITVIVNTTENITRNSITENSTKILLSVLFATLAIIFVVGIYTSYLYINIRQLFKGIIAISKGNYERQIRLLTTAFTPHEIIFLAFEFNRMATEIHKSYIQLKKNNVELNKLNEFRSNLIDTVSHELRTPLTSIQGYTTRLMRQDIEIDEETKQKSLRIIKEQSERLKNLIEDLLTVPDIEGMRLKTVSEQVFIPEVFEEAKNLIKNKEQKEILFQIPEDFPLVIADKERLIQVFANLLENGVKYASENSRILVSGTTEGNLAKIYIKNNCEVIPQEQLDKLFEKFVRIDDDTTRTTRGTGLGLFIVKGLVEAMNGSIKITSDETCGFCVEISLNLAETSDTAEISDTSENTDTSKIANDFEIIDLTETAKIFNDVIIPQETNNTEEVKNPENNEKPEEKAEDALKPETTEIEKPAEIKKSKKTKKSKEVKDAKDTKKPKKNKGAKKSKDTKKSKKADVSEDVIDITAEIPEIGELEEIDINLDETPKDIE